jgi:hypothetical protein
MNFFIANETHDAQLRNALRRATMPGHIQIGYEREPHFFHGLNTLGTFSQVIVAEQEGHILGFGCRSARPLFINGNVSDFGYLSSLRSLSSLPQKTALARGYKFLKHLHQEHPFPGYLTTIVAGNNTATSTIARGRAGLPAYHDLGEGRTIAIPLNPRLNIRPNPSFETRFARPGEEQLVVKLLNQFGAQKQFFPHFKVTDFSTPLLRDLPVERFILTFQKNSACAVAALWNQSAFKQHRIHNYSPTLNRILPAVNPLLKWSGFSPLPQKGETIKQACLCFMAAQDNAPILLKELLKLACRTLCQEKVSFCITGFHEKDPAASIVSGIPSLTYRSRLFFVGWDAETAFYHQLDDRIPAFEPAIL